MRRPILPGLCLTAILVVAAGCADDVPPHLSVSDTVLDFGRVLHGDTIRGSVELRNGSGRVVAITRIWGNCACFEVPAFNRMLQPGETRRVEVIFRSALVPPERLRGKKLTILSNDSVQPEIEVDLAGELVQSCTLNPERIDFGTLEPPVEPRVLRLREGPGMTLELLSARATPPGVLELATEAVDGTGADLTLSVKPEASGTGAFRGAVEVKVRASGGGFEARDLEYVVRVQGEWPGD